MRICIIFKKESREYFYTFNHFLVKSLQKEQNSTNLLLQEQASELVLDYHDPRSAGINVQSPQSESISMRLTLLKLMKYWSETGPWSSADIRILYTGFNLGRVSCRTQDRFVWPALNCGPGLYSGHQAVMKLLMVVLAVPSQNDLFFDQLSQNMMTIIPKLFWKPWLKLPPVK